MKIVVGGINGVGKTTLLKRAAHRAGMLYVSGSAALLGFLGHPGDYEKLRALPVHQQDKAWTACVQELLSSRDSIILDAHYLSLVRGVISHREGKPWLANVDAMALVTAPIDDIFRRIESDHATRDRALFPSHLVAEERKDMLAAYQEATRNDFLTLAQRYKRPSIEIVNHNDNLDRAVGDLLAFIHTF